MPRNNGVRALLSSRTFLRLWAIGGCVNTMRSFEVLAAALFTLDVTGSGLAVAVVSAARTLPMLLLGAFAGVMSEAVDRKRILLIGQIMSGLGSATIAVLAAFGVARPGMSALPRCWPAPCGPPRCPRAGAWSANASKAHWSRAHWRSTRSPIPSRA